jgi:Queuine tRNA-ribosyltransferase/Family of unknown function (DUF6884)
MKVLIITSCTGEKKSKPDNQLTLTDFKKIGSKEFKHRENELSDYLMPAEEIYTGQQHKRLMKGVHELRNGAEKHQIDLRVISAGYGLISGNKKIAPYECTFQGMKVKEISAWADHLNVPKDIRKALSEPYDLGLILLGEAYLKACELDDQIALGGPTILFCGTVMAKRLPDLKSLKIVPLSNPEAKRFSCALVALKGELSRRLLLELKNKPSIKKQLFKRNADVLRLLDDQNLKLTKARSTSKSKDSVDKVIKIPQSWWDQRSNRKLHYFIPEWDDLVDPDYDFDADTHSSGTGDWSNEVYAHQMYPTPNYDGILMSRAVAEKSKKKAKRINEMGVHRYLRVPREYSIMGDCGAFDYIAENVPPYSTHDVIDYYTRLGFDYGVSVDHLIVRASEQQKKYRYDLTIQNAEDFLKEHKKQGLPWEPIGAVQGWSPKSYAKAAAQYVKMGYKWIGLGGLVRSSTKVILAILEEVHRNIPKGINVHLFGLARLNAILEFKKYGVTSVDSASALRRAWLGGKDNYWSLTGDHYRAIRIPEAGKSFRAKRMVSEGRADADFVNKIEKKCISAVRQYDQGKLKINQVLDVIDEYDHLITSDRDGMREQYRRTLEDKPWKQCQCDICRKDGVEVVIFRGNNRNRRRGFHNIYVFYKLLRQVLETGDASFLFPNLKATTDSKQMPLF